MTTVTYLRLQRTIQRLHLALCRRWSVIVLMASLALLGVAPGCKDLIPPRPPIGNTSKDSVGQATAPNAITGNENETSSERVDAREAVFEGDGSHWYVHRFGNQIVGVTELQAAAQIDPKHLTESVSEVRYLRRERLVFRANHLSFTRRTALTSIEALDGSLKSFVSDIDSGPVSSQIHGTRSGEKLTIRVLNQGQTENRQIEWPAATKGLFALEQTLRRRPIRKGETRRLSVLTPAMASIGLVELHSVGDASVPMLDGSYRLLHEVEVVTYQDAQPIDSVVVWVDENGVIEKALRPELRLETFRCDRATADDRFGGHDDSRVRVSVLGELRSDQVPTKLSWMIKPDAQENRLKPPAVAMQSVKVSAEGIEVRVTSQPVSTAGFETDVSVPAPEDTAATAIIDCGQAAVTRMATSLGELPTAELAKELSHLVKNDLSYVPQGPLRSASVVIRSGEGGVVDHAVAFLALLRARQIPARLAIGIVREPTADRTGTKHVIMKLAAWVVAAVDGQWITIDPMTTQINRTDQLCLVVLTADQDWSESMTMVFQQLAELEITILQASYD